jgi:hypothetical protein
VGHLWPSVALSAPIEHDSEHNFFCPQISQRTILPLVGPASQVAIPLWKQARASVKCPNATTGIWSTLLSGKLAVCAIRSIKAGPSVCQRCAHRKKAINSGTLRQMGHHAPLALSMATRMAMPRTVSSSRVSVSLRG